MKALSCLGMGERVTEAWILIMMLILFFTLEKKAVFLLY